MIMGGNSSVVCNSCGRNYTVDAEGFVQYKKQGREAGALVCQGKLTELAEKARKLIEECQKAESTAAAGAAAEPAADEVVVVSDSDEVVVSDSDEEMVG